MTPQKSSMKTSQIMDVRRPGKTPAHPSARPIIVTHRPQVQDDAIKISAKTEHENLGEAIPVSVTQPEPTKLPEPKIIETPAPSPEPVTSIEQTTEMEPQNEQLEQLVHNKTYLMPVAQPPRPRRVGLWLSLLFVVVVFAVIFYFITSIA